MKKLILVLTLVLTGVVSFAQKPYQDEKKWGISKNGDKDSIIFRAEFDEISTNSWSGGVFYAGIRNEEWQALTSNPKVNQQRYESVTVYPFAMNYACGLREGYIDIIDLAKADFLIRGVQAISLFDGSELVPDSSLLMTQVEGNFGLVDIVSKKEILKAEYSKIRQLGGTHIEFVGLKNGKNMVFDNKGVLVFELPFAEEIVDFEEVNKEGMIYELHTAKGLQGWYDSSNKWFVPPIYTDVQILDKERFEAIIVYSKKGAGLCFQGNLIAPCVYEEVELSDERGYVAILTKKGREFYIDPEGKITPMKIED